MKTITTTFLMFTVAAGCAHAQTPSAPPAPATSPAAPAPSGDIDAILDALDRRGKELDDFTAKVSLTDTDSQTGDEQLLSGRMWMQRLPGDDARLRVLFDRKEAGGKPRTERSEYRLANGVLIDRDYGRHIEVHRQVLKPGQKMNLLNVMGVDDVGSADPEKRGGFQCFFPLPERTFQERFSFSEIQTGIIIDRFN